MAVYKVKTEKETKYVQAKTKAQAISHVVSNMGLTADPLSPDEVLLIAGEVEKAAPQNNKKEKTADMFEETGKEKSSEEDSEDQTEEDSEEDEFEDA